MILPARSHAPLAPSTRFTSRLLLSLLGSLALAPALWADISGTVIDDAANPVAGATVHLQADPNGPSTTTDANGEFTLPVAGPGNVVVAAYVSYNRANATNYNTNAVDALNPSVGVEIELPIIPLATNSPYNVPLVKESCSACHFQIANEWSTSVHSGAGIDFWVRDLFSGDGSPGGGNGFVFTATHDPGDTGTCATCHQPMSDAFEPGNTFFNTNTGAGVADGVSCLGCHQIHALDNPNGTHTLGSAEYRFPLGGKGTDRFVWGPLSDVDTAFMRASYAPFVRSSELCASCHQYQRPFGQTTYDEWAASPFAVAGPNFRSCQDCHMPQRDSAGVICDLFGAPTRPAEQRHNHAFVGSTPSTLSANIALDTEVEQLNGRVIVRSTIDNFGAGHDFPTGVSIRNALLVLRAEVNGQPLVQVAGPTVPDWADDGVPGHQAGDYAGEPGKGFGKILEGRINGQGPVVWPVLFVDAENVRFLNKVPAGGTDTTEVEFALPGNVEPGANLHVEARLLYRRTFRELMVTKDWTTTPQGGPIEIEVQSTIQDLAVAASVIDVPIAGSASLLFFALLLAGVAIGVLRR